MMSARPRLDHARAVLAAVAPPAAGEVRVEIVGEIDTAMLDRVRSVLRAASRANILEIRISSHGGDVSAGFRIYDAIRAHGAAIKRAAVVSLCHSAAMLPLMGADHRRAERGASLLCHPTSRAPATTAGRWTSARYARHARALAETDAKVIDMMASRTGAPRAALEREDATEAVLPMSRAIALGIIHHVVGEPSRCRPDWPAFVQKIQDAEVPIGLPGFMLSAAFLAACRAAPGSR